MPNKPRERFYLQALRDGGADVPVGQALEPEPPDFVLLDGERRLGIEMTVFHPAPSTGQHPHQEQQSLKERVVNIAEQLHHQDGGQALYVGVYFNPNNPLTKKMVQPLARLLADAVMNYPVPESMCETAVEIPWSNRPLGVSGILIHGSVDGVDRLWSPDAGGWVVQVTSQQVAEVVRKKAQREPLARKQCDDLWLVIVNDDFSGAAPSEISDEALTASYQGLFDRLSWLVPHSRRVMDLRIAPTTAQSIGMEKT